SEPSELAEDCPARGTGAALVLPSANAEAMNLHPAEISTCVSLCAHPVVTLDGAGRHPPGDKLKVPDNISLLPLPPYSPRLNPAGPSTGSGVWQYLRQNHLSNRVFDTYDTIVNACCDACNKLIAQPQRITSIATRTWALKVKT
ncbi:MAG: hypothetical protein ACREC4_03275, partial [Methylocella sp.]